MKERGSLRIVFGSLQTVSSRDRAPDKTSMMPAVAPGARLLDRDGFLRSQSTMMTRLPACAMSWASEAVMVDFPSLGRAEVMPTILFEVFVGFKSIASFIERIDSANRDNGKVLATQYIPELLESVLWANSLSP